MMLRWSLIAPMAVACLGWTSAHAQQQSADVVTENVQADPASRTTPRTADGRPDLTGTWYTGSGSRQNFAALQTAEDGVSQELVRLGSGPPPRVKPPSNIFYKPELLAKVKELDELTVEKDPAFRCRPPGLPRVGPPQKIFQSSDEIAILYSDLNGNFWRVVPTDGRPHADVEPSYFGDSVGYWEGDTLVIDVVNFNEDTWLADFGYFHSSALHVVERLTRAGDTLRWEVTVEDPNVLTKPWILEPRVLELTDEKLEEAPPCIDNDSHNLVNLEHHPEGRY